MIRVTVTGPPKTGFYPYRVDWWFRGRPQLTGAWPLPLYDACWKLKQYGLMDDTQVGLFIGDEPHWRIQTTVGEGTRKWLEPLNTVLGQHREYPDHPLPDVPNLEPPIVVATDEPPARSEAPPPAPKKPPKRRAGKRRAAAKSATSAKPRHKPKRAKSAGRRGSR